MTKPLLIEIGVEELPAVPFLKELPNIETKWTKILESHALVCEFEFYYTPRRLVFWHPEFSLKQPTRFEEFFGAPEAVAFKDGEPTPAALGFARKCGVDVNALDRAEKDGKRVLYFKKEIEGVDAKSLIGTMVGALLKELNFGKSMRWGSLEESFIRPIRWLGCMLGDEHVPFSLYGVESKYFSYPHRTISYEPFAYDFAGDYFAKLEKSGVILYPDARREKILAQMDTLEAKEGIVIERDAELLEEVVAITEYPTVLMGSFDEHFLQVPPEVIITSMKEHQRYFPVFEEGRLTNKFIVVSNAITQDYQLIIEGNQRVLRARLSDALFFWENDLRNGLSSEGLKDIVYLDGLGSVYDKVQREQKVALYLSKHYMPRLQAERPDLESTSLVSLMERTVGLCKADLLSEMVYEFTELQGLMGYYYAKEAKQDESLALAFKEQYLPDSEESDLPSSLFSAIVALSYKIDSLLALFSIGEIPTGTKDPFALRRAVNGIIKIVLDQKIPFDIRKDFAALASIYKAYDSEKLEAFFLERVYQFFDANPSIIKAVLESGERDIITLSQKITALKNIASSSEFRESFSTFKRVANIIKDVDITSELTVDSGKFEAEEERALFAAFTGVIEKNYEDYEEKLDALFNLKPKIDAFFNNVMVNAEDSSIKQNRQNLIGSIYQAFRSIADIKEISV